jgi:hypothetical protein
MKRISKEQKAFFLDQGYLILENILDENHLSPVIDELNNEIDKRARILHADAPAACFPPEADFLVRSKSRSEQVIKSYEEFNRLRETFKGDPVTNRFNVQWKELQKDEV